MLPFVKKLFVLLSDQFKTDFCENIENFGHHLVYLTEVFDVFIVIRHETVRSGKRRTYWLCHLRGHWIELCYIGKKLIILQHMY